MFRGATQTKLAWETCKLTKLKFWSRQIREKKYFSSFYAKGIWDERGHSEDEVWTLGLGGCKREPNDALIHTTMVSLVKLAKIKNILIIREILLYQENQIPQTRIELMTQNKQIMRN